ncbi:hypothetical protein FF2_009789 [Malus domestica]
MLSLGFLGVLEYAGTYALKGDPVRYGKQTFGGIIKDGMSALSRYFLSNFSGWHSAGCYGSYQWPLYS